MTMTLSETTELDRALSADEAAAHYVLARCGAGPLHDLLAAELDEVRWERAELRAGVRRGLAVMS